jgi:hypothetical protein
MKEVEDYTYFNDLVSRTTLKAGKFLYSAESSDKMSDVPYRAVRREAQCHKENPGIITVYKTKTNIRLLDFDNYAKRGFTNSLHYLYEIKKSLGLRGKSEKHLKMYICKYLGEILDGYKWLAHDDEIFICKKSKFLAEDHVMTCEEAEELIPKNKRVKLPVMQKKLSREGSETFEDFLKRFPKTPPSPKRIRLRKGKKSRSKSLEFLPTPSSSPKRKRLRKGKKMNFK